MKTKRHLIIFGLFLSLTAFSVCDTSRPETEFLILITGTDDGLQLVCKEGCAWKELSFSLKNGKYQLIDQYGMTSVGKKEPSQDKLIANFLLRVQKNKGGIHLEGKKGTSWTVLNFSCLDKNCSQYIDQDGMTSKK
ncbi:MAG: hypothetical protein RH948_17330 [Cyclobacteriaceae bacterium]